MNIEPLLESGTKFNTVLWYKHLFVFLYMSLHCFQLIQCLNYREFIINSAPLLYFIV